MTTERERVGAAIGKAWRELSDVPFPLYERELFGLADAAIAAIVKARAAYEYKITIDIVPADETLENAEARMNEMGAEGWMLVQTQVLPYADNQTSVWRTWMKAK